MPFLYSSGIMSNLKRRNDVVRSLKPAAGPEHTSRPQGYFLHPCESTSSLASRWHPGRTADAHFTDGHKRSAPVSPAPVADPVEPVSKTRRASADSKLSSRSSDPVGPLIPTSSSSLSALWSSSSSSCSSVVAVVYFVVVGCRRRPCLRFGRRRPRRACRPRRLGFRVRV